MTGYLGDKQKGFVTIDNKKYYKTGDIVSIDASQNLCIHGRSTSVKDFGNRLSWKIESRVISILNDPNIILIALEDRGCLELY